MKLRKSYLPAAALLGAAVAVVPALASPELSPTVSGLESRMWSPMEVAVKPGGSVTFQNTSGVVPHGVVWEAGNPETPVCTAGVPIEKLAYNWKGSCTFAKEGEYKYYCYVHGLAMSGVIFVNPDGAISTTTSTATTTTTTTPTITMTTPTTTTPTTPTTTSTTPTATTSTQPSSTTNTSTAASTATTPGSMGSMEMPPAPGESHPVATLALASAQHGDAVHGAVEIPAADAGARLEVELLAQTASLAKVKRSSSSRVGRLVRSSEPAGKVSFTVSLNAAAKHALHRHHKLALTVKIMLMPTHGTGMTITRSVVVRA